MHTTGLCVSLVLVHALAVLCRDDAAFNPEDQ
jgi:hypothetical protein